MPKDYNASDTHFSCANHFRDAIEMQYIFAVKPTGTNSTRYGNNEAAFVKFRSKIIVECMRLWVYLESTWRALSLVRCIRTVSVDMRSIRSYGTRLRATSMYCAWNAGLSEENHFELVLQKKKKKLLFDFNIWLSRISRNSVTKIHAYRMLRGISLSQLQLVQADYINIPSARTDFSATALHFSRKYQPTMPQNIGCDGCDYYCY